MKCHEPRSHSSRTSDPPGLTNRRCEASLLAAASERSDQVAGMDEIERLRLELALEEIIDDEFYVGDSFGLQK